MVDQEVIIKLIDEDSLEIGILHIKAKDSRNNNELYTNMNEYRKRSFMLQMADGDTYLDDIARLRDEFEYVVNNSLVSEFLIAEQRLNKMTRQINSSVIDCINLDVDFLGDW